MHASAYSYLLPRPKPEAARDARNAHGHDPKIPKLFRRSGKDDLGERVKMTMSTVEVLNLYLMQMSGAMRGYSNCARGSTFEHCVETSE
jgi:hypothetical protein